MAGTLVEIQMWRVRRSVARLKERMTIQMKMGIQSIVAICKKIEWILGIQKKPLSLSERAHKRMKETVKGMLVFQSRHDKSPLNSIAD
jgi:hypothetical protein